jgi:DNA-binding MarR family transcriptional regulator
VIVLRCCSASLSRPLRPAAGQRVTFRLTPVDAEAADAVPREAMPFTPKQGQYLAFIYYYTKIHGRPPAEADLQRFFRVTPPVVHQMVKTLAARGFIDREPGTARSIRLRLTRAQLPDLE